LSKGLIAACLRNFKLLNPPDFSRRLATTRNKNINFFTPGQKENMQICQETKHRTGTRKRMFLAGMDQLEEKIQK